MLDLGINNENISFEVAIDILGQYQQPIVRALCEEKLKANPSQLLISYYDNRLSALVELQKKLTPMDVDVVQRILDKETEFRIN